MSNQFSSAVLAAAMLAAPALLYAQRDSVYGGELASYGGFISGIGTHAAVGASSGALFSRYGMGVIDISFSPLGEDLMYTNAIRGMVRQSRLYSFDFEGHVLIPTDSRWEPYGIVGAGFLHSTYRMGTPTITGGITYSGVTHDNFAFHTGGGVRYFVSETWGIRPELKVIISSRNFVRASVGIFYTVGPDFFFRWGPRLKSVVGK